jgi:hypothetical protein
VFQWCKASELKREWGMGGPTEAPKTPAAPATVRGEQAFIRPLSFWMGRRKHAVTHEARRPALQGETRCCRV